jgi:hypothetical protein
MKALSAFLVTRLRHGLPLALAALVSLAATSCTTPPSVTSITPTRTIPVSTYSRTSTAMLVSKSDDGTAGYRLWDVRHGRYPDFLPDFGNPPPWGVRAPAIGQTYRVVRVLQKGKRYETHDGSIWAVQSPYHKDARHSIHRGTLLYPISMDKKYLTCIVGTGPSDEGAVVAWIER